MPGVSRQAKPQRPAYAVSHIPGHPGGVQAGPRAGASERLSSAPVRTGRLVSYGRRDRAVPGNDCGCCR
jgi:hypothetical protein